MSIEFKKRHCNEGFKIFLVVNGHYFIERWRYYCEAFILEGDSILAQLKKDDKLKKYIVDFNEVYYGNDKEKIKWINRIENELKEDER